MGEGAKLLESRPGDRLALEARRVDRRSRGGQLGPLRQMGGNRREQVTAVEGRGGVIEPEGGAR